MPARVLLLTTQRSMRAAKARMPLPVLLTPTESETTPRPLSAMPLLPFSNATTRVTVLWSDADADGGCPSR